MDAVVARSATGRELPFVTGDEDFASFGADIVGGVACAPEDRVRVAENLAKAANVFYDTDILRGVACRSKGNDFYVVFPGFKTEVKASDRAPIQKKMGLR